MDIKPRKDIPQGTTELLDQEKLQRAEHLAKIGRITLKIEELLLQENMTMGDLSDILDTFNARAQFVFAKTKLSDIKKTYDGFNK